jgi:DNA polymerase-3 subunit gamma/tau
VLWQQLCEACKGRLPAMYRVFLDKCMGSAAGGVLTVLAPDEMTRGRLDNDRVLTALRECAQTLTGAAVRVALQVGAVSAATPEDRRKNLIDFGSRFDNIQIK